MSSYTKLFDHLLRSTVWTQESKETKLVWITMLALKGRDHKVFSSIPGLARTAGVSLEECVEALERLKAPDPFSQTKEKEGRRIEEVEGGWLIINGEKYRNMMSLEERREYKRVWAANKRAEQPAENGSTHPSGDAKSAHPPAGSPKHAQEAQAIGEIIGVPPEFSTKVYHRLVESGWKDETKGPIKNFRLYLKSAWENERQKPTKKTPETTEIQEQIKVPHL